MADKHRPLSHAVFFTLHDRSDEARDALLADCRASLPDHDGVTYFSVGTLAAELDRPVNDQQFDVALLVAFRDRASHDAYQDSPKHHAFIARNRDNWKQVRVFDTDLAE